MAAVADWTERHRPKSESHLEGNEAQRQKIRKWLDDWKNGTPKNKAIGYINKTENYNRLFYTGFMGLFEKQSCDIYVNIRCAKIVKDNLTIYVGGGITKESNASAEWNEIVNKSQTMLGVFHSQ